jgi:hypothetical protein
MENRNKRLSIIKAISLAVIAGGILLLFFGINTYDSSSYGLFRFLIGSATDKSTLVLMAGVVATDVGFLGLLRGSKTF